MNTSNSATAVATGTGLVFAGIFAGSSYASTFWTVPALVLSGTSSPSEMKIQKSSSSPSSSPSHLVRQWRDVYNKGKVFGPIVSSTSAASWVYAASTFPKSTYGRNLHLVGALLFMCIAPYTLTVMARTNAELSRRAAVTDTEKELNENDLDINKAKSVEEYPTRDLLVWWSILNLGRGLLPLAAVACVAYGSLTSL